MIQSIGNQAICLAPQLAAQSGHLLASISRVALSALSSFSATFTATHPTFLAVVVVAVVVIALLLIFKSATGQSFSGRRADAPPIPPYRVNLENPQKGPLLAQSKSTGNWEPTGRL